jgi:hypothetical protein
LGGSVLAKVTRSGVPASPALEKGAGAVTEAKCLVGPIPFSTCRKLVFGEEKPEPFCVATTGDSETTCARGGPQIISTAANGRAKNLGLKGKHQLFLGPRKLASAMTAFIEPLKVSGLHDVRAAAVTALLDRG